MLFVTMLYNRSVVRNLRCRETYGTSAKGNFSNHHNLSCCRLFSNVPKRLAFSLKLLVDEHILMEEAHVFLGFNSDGTYVISYTESFEAMDQSGLPYYMYHLHWWLFRFDQKMIKVHTVRLFANEEILSSLHLCYTEWPTDKTKILVYGGCRSSDVAYITVSAVPSKVHCEDCNKNALLQGTSSKCLKHGFVAHMTYTSVSSSSAVLNASGMQIDNLIVLNMGFSIGVISLGIIPPDKDIECFPLSSIKRATFEEKPSNLETDDFLSPSLFDKAIDANLLLSPRLSKTNRNMFLSSAADCEKSSTGFKNNSFAVSSDTQPSSAGSAPLSEWDSLSSQSPNDQSQPISFAVSSENQVLLEHCTCANNYSATFGSIKDGKNDECKIDPYVDPEPKSIVLSQRDCENTYSNTAENAHQTSQESGFVAHKVVASAEASENCCCGYTDAVRCKEHKWVEDSIRPNDKNTVKQDSVNTKPGIDKFSKLTYDSIEKNHKQKQASHKQVANMCGYCGLKIKESKTCLKKKESTVSSLTNRNILVGSPGRNSSKLPVLYRPSVRNSRDQEASSVELNAPTPSPSASESSGSVYCTGDTASQASAKSGNCRKSDGILSFYETLFDAPTDSTQGNAEDNIMEGSLFYGPVTFQDAYGLTLQPVKSDSCESAAAYSQHLVLDIEHVIFDVLRTRCYTTYKFGYLIDYEVQIVDTCPNTRSVVVLIIALLNVVPRKAKTKFQEHRYRLNGNFDATNNMLQFHFFICWQLQTGHYEVVAASPLKVYDPKKSGKWDAGWVLEKRHDIRRACAIPQLNQRSVYVLSNSSVIKGRSLEYLWDVDRVIALKK